MLKIYGAPTYNALKVVLTAEEAGMDYDYIEMNLAEGEQKSPEHLERHVLGKVPAIEHDGNALFESGAICRYLAQVSDSSLYAGDDYQRAVIDQWVDLMSEHVGRWLTTHYYQEFIKPVYFKQDTDQAALEEAQIFLKDQLPAVDKQLAKYSYLAGDTFSIADIFAFSYFQTHERTSVDFGEYVNISRWYEEVGGRPAVIKAVGVVKA